MSHFVAISYHQKTDKKTFKNVFVFFVLSEQRKKIILDGQTPFCPVCGLTLRPGEADTHLQQEFEKLERLSTKYVLMATNKYRLF